MSNRSAIRPKLHDCGGKPSGRWFVYYSYLNPVTGKMKRFKCYDGLNNLEQSLEERHRHANALILQINRKLDAGWNPFQDNEKFLYANVIGYHSTGELNQTKKAEFTIDYYCNYVLTKRKNQIRKTSFDSYRSQLRVFHRWLKKKSLEKSDISQLSKDHIENFLDDLKTIQGKNNTTRNNYLTNLKGLFKQLTEERIITVNPFEKINALPQNKESKKAFTRPQIQEIKKTVCDQNRQLWLFIQMMYYTYIRPRELRFLKIGDIDLEEEKILIRSEISKNKKSQYVTIPSPLMRHLQEFELHCCPRDHYLFGNTSEPGPYPCSKNYFYKQHQEVLTALKFPSDYSLYSWKHTGVKEAVKNGVPLKEIQLQLRHHSLDQVDQYLKSLGITECENIKNQFPVI